MVVRMIVARVGQAVLSLLCVALLIFVLVRLSGDPVNFLLTSEASQDDIDRVRAELGLDRPVWVQFLTFLENLAQGNLGVSHRLDASVTEVVGLRLPATLSVAGLGLLLVLVIGVPLGVYSAVHRGGRLDAVARGIAALGQATPAFWLALMLILVFSVNLGVLPPGGQDGPRSLILPAVAVAFEPLARLIRLLRSSMIEELQSPHIRFLHIKGLPERKVLWVHALRNAGLTSLTYLGILSVSLIMGSVLVETVFSLPGVGRLLVESIYYRDFNVVQGIVMLMSAGYIVVNLLIDLAQLVLDPKLRTAVPA